MNSTQSRRKRLKPCKVCGSRKITLWDCGYSSFNPGGGRCENGHEGKGEAGCSPNDNMLADLWNEAQKPTDAERVIALLGSERELRRINAAMRKALRRVKVNADDLIKLRGMGVKI
jgi:hypothetical protein